MKKSIGIHQSHSVINTNMEEKMCSKTIILIYTKNGKKQVSLASYQYLEMNLVKKMVKIDSLYIMHYISWIRWFSGCVMTGVTRHGGDFATIKNVSNYSACNKLCSEKDDCIDWTYIEGACYVKTENTFWVRNKNVVGGYKDCDSATRTGQLLIRFLLSF